MAESIGNFITFSNEPHLKSKLYRNSELATIAAESANRFRRGINARQVFEPVRLGSTYYYRTAISVESTRDITSIPPGSVIIAIIS